MTLYQAMQETNTSVERLADLTALTERQIKSYMYGERRPSDLNIGRIERVLKTKIDWGYKDVKPMQNN